MGKRIHDFSQETVEDIQKTLQKSIEEDEQQRLMEWWDDSWRDLTNEVGISHYLADVESYRLEVKGRHESALHEFDRLLEKVHTIVNPDVDLQTGIANMVEGWGSGGGQQFETLLRRLVCYNK